MRKNNELTYEEMKERIMMEELKKRAKKWAKEVEKNTHPYIRCYTTLEDLIDSLIIADQCSDDVDAKKRIGIEEYKEVINNAI